VDTRGFIRAINNLAIRRRRFESSRNAAGMKRRNGAWTSRDIATAAGVSQATVSNVLNRPALVAAETRERVLAAIKRMDFVINDSARTLRGGRSRTLGVIALDLTNPFWGEVTRGVSEAASDRGYSVLLGSSGESREGEQDLLRLFEEHRVDGVLVSSVDIHSPAIMSLTRRDITVVLLDELDTSGRYGSVSLDQAAGARLVGEHLLAEGHRRIGFINVSHDIWWARERSRGLREAVQTANEDPATVISEQTISTMTAHIAEPAVGTLLSAAPDITAIFCVNDMVALGVLKKLRSLNLSVPGDISVVGFDDSHFAGLLSPALTTVRQQPYRLGRTAAELAINRNPGDPIEAVIYEPVLVVRESTRTTQMSDHPIPMIREDGSAN
jgi:LacI family transcriptional regulator